VSENSLSDASAEVCRKFADLPILYLSQRPPLPPLLHAQVIWEYVQHPLVAILHDDDWWASWHIAAALNVLDSNTSCVGVVSQFYETQGPSHFFNIAPRLWLFWVATGCDFSKPALILSDEQVLLGELLSPCFHFSTMVGRLTAFKDAFQNVCASGNDFDTDRMIGSFLADHGKLAFLTMPDTFIRQHDDQEARRPELFTETEEKIPVFMDKMRKTSRWLARRDPRLLKQAADVFNKNLSCLPPQAANRVKNIIPEPLRKVLVEECGFTHEIVSGIPPLGGLNTSFPWLLKQLCPPALISIMRRLAGAWTNL